MSGGSAINKVKNENELISKNETDSFSAEGKYRKRSNVIFRIGKTEMIYFRGNFENDLISRMHIRIYRVEELRPSVACTVWAKYEWPLIYTVSKNLGDTKPGAPGAMRAEL